MTERLKLRCLKPSRICSRLSKVYLTPNTISAKMHFFFVPNAILFTTATLTLLMTLTFTLTIYLLITLLILTLRIHALLYNTILKRKT